MSRQDQTYSDWTGYFTERFGSGITRRNAAINVPIVQNFTFPLGLRQDGTLTQLPKVVRVYPPPVEEGVEEGLPRATGNEAFAHVYSNVNFRGDGTYNPEEHRNGLHFELPEFRPSNSTKLETPGVSRRIPLHIRRQAFI